jgi:hypothetical protein
MEKKKRKEKSFMLTQLGNSEIVRLLSLCLHVFFGEHDISNHVNFVKKTQRFLGV